MWLKIRHMDIVFKELVFSCLYQICKQNLNIFMRKKMLDELFFILKGFFVRYCYISKKYCIIGNNDKVSCCKIFLSTGFQQ